MEKIKQLSEKMDGNAIQRTKGVETKKGYDTTGVGYQFCVNRFNEVFGTDWGFSYHILKEVEGAYRSGQKYFNITVEVGIWVEKPENVRACIGGHTSADFADALKGAITNGFKKTAGFWGVGREAYEGTLDDDNIPLPEKASEIVNSSEKWAPKKPTLKEAKKDEGKPFVNPNICWFGKNEGVAWKTMSINQLEWYLGYLKDGHSETKAKVIIQNLLDNTKLGDNADLTQYEDMGVIGK